MGAAWVTGGCSYAPMPSQPRPALPARAPAASAIAVPAPAVAEVSDLGGGRVTGVLTGCGESVRFHRWRRIDGAAARATVVLVPILAGGDELLRYVAQQMLERGFDVAFCARAGSALKPPQRGTELDELFRRTVLHQRILLAWLRRDAPDPTNTLFVLGMSIGGMVATDLAALEPGLRGVAICLSGGDLGGMIRDSSEVRVQSWVRWRKETDGVGDDHLRWELRQFLRHEPLGFAASVPTAKVLFVSADFDTVVPPRHQDLLWEALGRPARLRLPLGHYTAALAIQPILAAAASHFESLLAVPLDDPRCAAPPSGTKWEEVQGLRVAAPVGLMLPPTSPP